MDKFIIPERDENTTKNIRFPNKMIAEVEEVITGTKATFSSYVVASVRWSLDNLKEQNALEKKKKDL